MPYNRFQAGWPWGAQRLMRRRIMLRHVVVSVAVAGAALFGAATAAQAAPRTALDRTIAAGWNCADIAGAMHCFDPGDVRSSNAKSVNVKVYDYAGAFLGTEQIWTFPMSGPRQCPQDQLLNVGFGLACHHYAN
jgi:hypothetical protein